MELVSLSVEGVRSFKPALAATEFQDGQILEFDQPLVLIQGSNGSGKSTIIEALQHMTTGKLPCGTQTGSTYISDPREEGKDGVFGRTVLTMKRREARSTDCVSLIWEGMSTHTLGQDSPKISTLRASIDSPAGLRDFGIKKMQAEVQNLLKLNSVLLSHVLFCTRPDSHSFIQEPSKIKRIFDEIFDLKHNVGNLDNLIDEEKRLIKELLFEQRNLDELKRRYRHYCAKKTTLEELQERLKNRRFELRNLAADRSTAKKHLEHAQSIRKHVSLNYFENLVHDANLKLHKAEGAYVQLVSEADHLQKELDEEFYTSAQQWPEQQRQVEEIRQNLTRTKTNIVAMDEMILSSHQAHIAKINTALRDKWQKFYKRSDIEYIQIRSDQNSASLNLDESYDPGADEVQQTKFRKVYNYRVVKCYKGVETNLRGACSSGQMAIASLLIRLVLAEMFAATRLNVIALDDPSCELDAANQKMLVETLKKLVSAVNSSLNPENGRLQLIVTSQSLRFVRKLAKATKTPYYTHVEKGDRYSTIRKRVVAYLDVRPNAQVGSPLQKRRRLQSD